MNKLVASVALLSASVSFALAGTPAAVGNHKTKAAALVCPVTGETIKSISQAAGHSTYKGKTYYFCCAGCKPSFDKNPAKFVKTASKPKG